MREQPIYCKVTKTKRRKSVHCHDMTCETCKIYKPSNDKLKETRIRNISRYDQLHAIKRLPGFIDDYNNIKMYEKYMHSNRKSKRMKYDKLHAEFVERWTDGHIMFELVDSMPADMLAEPIKQVASIDRKPIDLYGYHNEDTLELNFKMEGERLYLEVDLRASNDKLTKKFKDILSRYRKLCSGKLVDVIRKDRRRDYNPWKIYDMHIKEKLNYSEITRRLTGLKGTSEKNKKLKSETSKVTNAYKAAMEMIAQVDKELSSRSEK